MKELKDYAIEGARNESRWPFCAQYRERGE